MIANNTGGTGSLNKLRFGTLTLGGANTYTGATNVRNGSLILNFADAAAPTTNIINSASTLVLGGATAGLGQNNNATLSMTGKASHRQRPDIQQHAHRHLRLGDQRHQRRHRRHRHAQPRRADAHARRHAGRYPTNAGTINTTTTVATTNGILGGWAIAGTPATSSAASRWAPRLGDGRRHAATSCLTPGTSPPRSPTGTAATNWHADAGHRRQR